MNRILFTHYGDNHIRGSERCLLDLIKHLDKNVFEPVVWCNSELLAREVKKLQVHVIKSDFPILFGWLPSKYDFRQFFAIVRQGLQIVSEQNINIIHANGGAPNQWLNLIARIKKLPLISHLHSRYPLRDRLSLGLLNTSLVVGVSQPVINQLLDDGIARDRVKVIPNGIDTSYHDQALAVDVKRLLGLKPTDFVAITVGSLIQRKGIDNLIRAIACLKNRDLPVHLVIVGDGPEKTSLQCLVNKYRLQSRVHFLGERCDVAGLLRGGVDVYVSAATEEVFGLALAEANLASIPVIAPSVGGIPGVIKNHETGILVPVGSSFFIAGAIQHLYRHPRVKITLGHAGRKRVLEKFNIENYVQSFQNIYLDLIHDHEKHLGIFSNASPGIIMKMLLRTVLIYSSSLLRLTGQRFQTCNQLFRVNR